jgi:hypothetical protein
MGTLSECKISAWAWSDFDATTGVVDHSTGAEMLGEWSVDCPEALDTPVAYSIEVEIAPPLGTPRIGLLAKIEADTIREAGTDDNPF